MSTLEFGITDGKLSCHSIFEKPLDITPEEELALDIIYQSLSGLNTEAAGIHAERRSTNYLSIVAFKDYDFIRLKIGEKSKWFSVFLSPKDRFELDIDPRFSKVSNKKQIHWKINLSSIEQLKEHCDLFQRAYTAAKWSFEKSSIK